ncbi:MAG: hypothetical protein AABW50_05125 [Nanoarchaeota archaeon]
MEQTRTDFDNARIDLESGYANGGSGIEVINYSRLNDKNRKYVRSLFQREPIDNKLLIMGNLLNSLIKENEVHADYASLSVSLLDDSFYVYVGREKS